MMMGVEDVRDLPAALVGLGQHRPGDGGSTTPTEPLCGSRISQT
jgi:hypothetical protein